MRATHAGSLPCGSQRLQTRQPSFLSEQSMVPSLIDLLYSVGAVCWPCGAHADKIRPVPPRRCTTCKNVVTDRCQWVPDGHPLEQLIAPATDVLAGHYPTHGQGYGTDTKRHEVQKINIREKYVNGRTFLTPRKEERQYIRHTRKAWNGQEQWLLNKPRNLTVGMTIRGCCYSQRQRDGSSYTWPRSFPSQK